MNRAVLASLAVVLVALTACQAPPPPEPPDHRAEAEAAVRGLIEQWAAAAKAKDAATFASFYADDAILMMEDAPDVRGAAALREAIPGMMSDPAFSLTFTADQVVASRSGDLAYETGSYSMSMSGPDGKPAAEQGHYIVVWRKQADGTWKVAADVPVSDAPVGAAAPATH